MMKSKGTLFLTQLGLLIALELVLAFTPLGYLSVPGLTITFLMVPVSIGAIVLGPTAGAVLGAVFGLTSFGQCFGASPFGAALLAISPALTFVLCVVPRVLAGWLPGLLFRALNRPGAGKARQSFVFGVSALAASLLNTLLFMTALLLGFFHTEYIQSMAQAMGAANPILFAALFVGVQGLIEAGVCCVISGLLSNVLCSFLKRSAS